MNIKILLLMFGLYFFSITIFSAELNVPAGIDNRLNGVRDFNEARNLINNSGLKNRSYNQFDNKLEYDIKESCHVSSSDESCAPANFLSLGTTQSYIDEYAVFAVVGTGIKLPEDQIESYDGIDD